MIHKISNGDRSFDIQSDRHYLLPTYFVIANFVSKVVKMNNGHFTKDIKLQYKQDFLLDHTYFA